MTFDMKPKERLAIGSDNIGFPLKEIIKEYLLDLGYECLDVGTNNEQRTHYPLFAARVASAIASGKVDLGILICGTGVGMAIAANKRKGIRAAACSEPYTAVLSRQHNNSNILAFGSQVVGPGLAKLIVKSWLEAAYEGGRHDIRLVMIVKMENGEDIED